MNADEIQRILNEEIEQREAGQSGEPAPRPEGDISHLPASDFAMTPMWGEFPEYVDNTILSTFRSCEVKAFRQYMQHLRKSQTSIHLLAGGAYAAGLEAARNAFYRDGKSEADARVEGVRELIRHWGHEDLYLDQNKSFPRMVEALEYSLDTWRLGVDTIVPYEVEGRNGVEFSFAVELPVDHPKTGLPILYTGRIDLLGVLDGALFVEDDKTTSALGPTWGAKWDLRSQFTGYTWALRQYGYPVAGTLVRGLAILKTRFDHAQAVVYAPDWKVQKWLDTTVQTLERMKSAWLHGHYMHDFADACEAFGGCPYKQLCNSPVEHRTIPYDFIQRRWDPLADVSKDKLKIARSNAEESTNASVRD